MQQQTQIYELRNPTLKYFEISALLCICSHQHVCVGRCVSLLQVLIAAFVTESTSNLVVEVRDYAGHRALA